MRAEPTTDSPNQEPGIAPPQHKARREDPFEELFMNEYGRVVAVANRVLADRGEAEDVAQEVFLDFHRRHRPDAGFAAAWLHQAAVHTSLNRLRSRRRREKRELTQALAERPAPAEDPARLAEVAEDRESVRQALTRLRPKAAAVLILRYSGLSYAEVGAALQVGTGQVGTLLRRAEQALKKELEDSRNGTPV
ncbi:MAG TPA: RNA polymerase sigma factor [Candidatus Dormibacteraeota bacterium]